jgi:hypothetical protein
LKQLIEYTAEEICLVCKGMPLCSGNGGELYILEPHDIQSSNTKPAIYLAQADNLSKRYASFYNNSYDSVKHEQVKACEQRLDEYYNPPSSLPKSFNRLCFLK